MDLNERFEGAVTALRQQAEVSPEDPAHLDALLAAFDAAKERSARVPRRDYWWMGALATAAAVMMATALGFSAIGRHGASSRHGRPRTQASTAHRVESPSVPGEFVIVPGAASLPPLESGSLVRMELPVSVLPSLGMTPPATGHATEVTADIVVGQDGLPRAVRLVE